MQSTGGGVQALERWREDSPIKQEQRRARTDANEGSFVSLVAKRKPFHLLASILSESRSADHQLTVREEKAV